MEKGFKGKWMLLVFLMIQLLLPGLSVAGAPAIPENPDTSGWFAWEWPNDEAALGSAIDASFMLDAPAGKHGYARAEGENIVFEDGTRARFWGVNIAMSASFLEPAEAEKLADRIVRSGFNIVRFHQMDYKSAGNIFSAGTPTQTKELSQSQLNKLFYLMSLLKEKGVYFYIDLLTMRPALAADGIVNPEDLSQGWKGHALFDPTLVSLQKEYARKLLTTENPYTHLTLANDPAMVFIDIQNENSLFVIDANRITAPYYINQLKTGFSQWLKGKYDTDAALETAWTQSGKVGLQASESMDNNTVDIIGDGTVRVPNLYDNLNYSTQRKNDSYEFFFETVRKHYTEMKAYLLSIGVKCLITGSSMGGYPSTVPASMYLNKELMDYTDRHVYMSHPSNYFTVGSSADNKPMVTNGNNFFQQAGYKRVFNQPFILGEWQECQTNDFRAEGDLMAAAMSSFQNWNAIQFQMLAEPIPYANPKIHTAFGTYNDPAHSIIQPAAAILFHRGDVKEAEDAYYYTYSKQDALNPAKGFPSSNIYRYGKVGLMFSGFADYNAALGSQTAFNKLETKRTSGETALSNELKWEAQSFSVNTPYTNAVAGLEPGQAKEFGDSIIQYSNPFAVISLNSITQDTLQNTDRMLLTAVARARNTGFTLNDGVIASTGQAPVLYEPVNGSITLKTGDDILVYALNSSGQRASQVTVEKTAEGYSRFQLQGQSGRVHYEIVKTSFTFKRNADLFKDVFDYPDNTTATTLVSSGVWSSQVSAENEGAYSKVINGALVMQGRTTEAESLSAPELRKNLPQGVVAGGHVLALSGKIRTGSVGSTSISLYDNAGGAYVAEKMVTLQNGAAKSGAPGTNTVAYTPGEGAATDSTGEYADVSIIINLKDRSYSAYVKGQPIVENAAIGNWNAANNLAIRLTGNYSRSTAAKNWGAFDQIRISPAFFRDSFDYENNTTAAALVSSGYWDGQVSAASEGAYSKVIDGALVMQGRTTSTGALSGPELRKNLPQGLAAGGNVITLTGQIRTGTIGSTAISLYDNGASAYVAGNMVVLQNGTAKSGASGSNTVAYAAGTGTVGDTAGEFVQISITLDLKNKRYSAYANNRTLVTNAPISNWNGINDLAIRIVGSYSKSTDARNWGAIGDFAIHAGTAAQ